MNPFPTIPFVNNRRHSIVPPHPVHKDTLPFASGNLLSHQPQQTPSAVPMPNYFHLMSSLKNNLRDLEEINLFLKQINGRIPQQNLHLYSDFSIKLLFLDIKLLSINDLQKLVNNLEPLYYDIMKQYYSILSSIKSVFMLSNSIDYNINLNGTVLGSILVLKIFELAKVTQNLITSYNCAPNSVSLEHVDCVLCELYEEIERIELISRFILLPQRENIVGIVTQTVSIIEKSSISNTKLFKLSDPLTDNEPLSAALKDIKKWIAKNSANSEVLVTPPKTKQQILLRKYSKFEDSNQYDSNTPYLNSIGKRLNVLLYDSNGLLCVMDQLSSIIWKEMDNTLADIAIQNKSYGYIDLVHQPDRDQFHEFLVRVPTNIIPGRKMFHTRMYLAILMTIANNVLDIDDSIIKSTLHELRNDIKTKNLEEKIKVKKVSNSFTINVPQTIFGVPKHNIVTIDGSQVIVQEQKPEKSINNKQTLQQTILTTSIPTIKDGEIGNKSTIEYYSTLSHNDL